ncbi:transposase [Streptomyces sp. 769]|uniref:transposase n=1 Tax=Streptomyces sp. 769 TaxID=1262452 RepID=UPI000581D737|nr:transposase [Streptomyces sp. 769]AJC60958.1 IS6 family transposase [Streptomyces sp. 769]
MEDAALRLEQLLFPSIANVAVLSVDVNNETVRIEACCTAAGAVCPGCGDRSSRVPGSYLRIPADSPSAGRRVVLCLRVRRFTCGNPSCDRRTFVEQVSGLTRRFGRWTETRRPVDLLPDREASSLAAWLAERPGIEVVCRDRAPFFAEGAATGAPQAVHVADRWHLWRNLGEAAERSVAQHRGCLRVLVAEPTPRTSPEPTSPEEASSSPWPTGHRFADRIRARHATVHALLEAGHSRRSIGRQLHMTHRTVKSLADAAKPEDLFRGQWHNNRTSVLDEYKPYLDNRWNEGCTAWKLWEETVPLGHKGTYRIVSAYIRKKRTSPQPVTAKPPSPRTVSKWRLSRPETLTEIEQLRLNTVLTQCPELEALTGHVRSFATMLTERQGKRLPQ